MKKLIGTVIGVAVGALVLGYGALVLGFWIAPGWTEGVMSHAVGLPSAQDRHDIGHLKTMVVPDLKQHGANCSAIKDIERKGKEGSVPDASIICTWRVYGLRSAKQSPGSIAGCDSIRKCDPPRYRRAE
jgi:hypothetical protein